MERLRQEVALSGYGFAYLSRFQRRPIRHRLRLVATASAPVSVEARSVDAEQDYATRSTSRSPAAEQCQNPLRQRPEVPDAVAGSVETYGLRPRSSSCEVGPRPDPMSLRARGKRPVQDGAVVFIQASSGNELHCQHAVARQLAPGPRQKRCNRVSSRSLAHMAPPVDHFQVRRWAQLLDRARRSRAPARALPATGRGRHRRIPRAWRRSRRRGSWKRSCGGRRSWHQPALGTGDISSAYRADRGSALSQLRTKLDDVAEPLGSSHPRTASPSEPTESSSRAVRRAPARLPWPLLPSRSLQGPC